MPSAERMCDIQDPVSGATTTGGRVALPLSIGLSVCRCQASAWDRRYPPTWACPQGSSLTRVLRRPTVNHQDPCCPPVHCARFRYAGSIVALVHEEGTERESRWFMKKGPSASRAPPVPQSSTVPSSQRSLRHGTDRRGGRDMRPRVEVGDLHKPSARQATARPGRQRLAHHDAQERRRRDDKAARDGALPARARGQDTLPTAARACTPFRARLRAWRLACAWWWRW